jgi:hypothetical protein
VSFLSHLITGHGIDQSTADSKEDFGHDEALACINRDYLGDAKYPSTSLVGAQFKLS